MRLIGIAGILALSSLACQRKEETSTAKPPATPAPAEAAAPAAPAPAGEKKEAPAPTSTKASERPEVAEKKPPVAEPVADKPGFVKSPFSGSIIDVRGIPAGRIVADPMFPASEKKHFRVPKLSPEDEAKANEEEARAKLAAEEAHWNALEAKPVPGKEGFIFSPYDQKIIDVNGMAPGEVFPDPGSPRDAPRYIKLPGGDPPAEGE
jgi:hypothetical protein